MLQYGWRGMPVKAACAGKSEAGRRMEEEGSALGHLSVVGTSPRPLSALSPGHVGLSPQGMHVVVLPVLDSVGIPAGALIPDVAGHGEGNHLRTGER